MLDDLNLIVRKIGSRFHLYGVEDETLSRRELSALLVTMQIPVEEIAFMHLAFHEDPQANEAHFGHFGTLLFVTKFYPQTRQSD